MPVRLPDRLPCGGGDGCGCDVRPKGRRERKDGPGFELVIVQCVAHRRCFTLYPIGWVPYGRTAQVPAPAAPCDATEASQGPAWGETAFGVVPRWLEVAVDRDLASDRRTRTRLVALSARWLGLSGTVADAEYASSLLSGRLAVWIAARAAYQAAPRWRSRAEAVDGALSAIADSDDLWQRMLRVGHWMGACGPAWLVDVSTGAIVPLVPTGERTSPRAG